MESKWFLDLDVGLFFTSMPSLIELVGIPVSSNLSEIQYFGGSFHWEVSQAQMISERDGTSNLFYI